MDCPWDGFTPATISFCEARLCEVVAEPANAFTSLSKTLVGLWLVGRSFQAGHKSARWLKWMLGCFAAGFAFWIADKTRFVCDPTNHLINGHAIWHLATSACLALFFEYEASAKRA